MDTVPETLTTPRLTLRAWCGEDAPALARVLARNGDHLGPWIPPAVSRAESAEALVGRLAGYADDFAAGRTWRWAVLTADGSLAGQASLHPRDAAERVTYAACDRIEVGYWIAVEHTGLGFATEAAGALCQLGVALARPRLLEMYIDGRNERSRRVASRLSFERLAVQPSRGVHGDEVALERWVRTIERVRPPTP